MKQKIKQIGDKALQIAGIALIGYSLFSCTSYVLEEREKRIALEQQIIALYPEAEGGIIHGDCAKNNAQYFIMGETVYALENNSPVLTEYSYDKNSSHTEIFDNDLAIICAEYYPPVGMFD